MRRRDTLITLAFLAIVLIAVFPVVGPWLQGLLYNPVFEAEVADGLKHRIEHHSFLGTRRMSWVDENGNVLYATTEHVVRASGGSSGVGRGATGSFSIELVNGVSQEFELIDGAWRPKH